MSGLENIPKRPYKLTGLLTQIQFKNYIYTIFQTKYFHKKCIIISYR